MTLPEKVREVERVFIELEAEISTFQEQSGLRCKTGCGKCCYKADLHATILEFLPFAYHAYRREPDTLRLYDAAVANPEGLCSLLDEHGSVGMCSQYLHRGLICRLFGFSARRNKFGKRELVTCSIIKTEQQATYDQTMTAMETDRIHPPMLAGFYQRLSSIDDELGTRTYPINQAIRKAFELVMHYYAYRELSEEG